MPPVKTTTLESETHKKNLKEYIERDHEYQKTLDAQHKRHMGLAQEKKHEIDVANNERRIRMQSRGITTFGKGYDSYGNGKTGVHSRVVFPGDKKKKKHHAVFKL
jgi:hypothetical protein